MGGGRRFCYLDRNPNVRKFPSSTGRAGLQQFRYHAVDRGNVAHFWKRPARALQKRQAPGNREHREFTRGFQDFIDVVLPPLRRLRSLWADRP
jgi:hypothetical protein